MGIIYVRKCLGKDFRKIDVYKIRTMRDGAEEEYRKMVLSGAKRNSYGKFINDPRISNNFQRSLRERRIDEIPQLYNLLKKDLKFVGIRPMTPEEWEEYPILLMVQALRQKPGLNGIHLAFPLTNDIADKARNMETYLNDYERDPVKCDREYFFKIWTNILFHGFRSR